MQSLVSFFITYEINKMQIKHSLIIAGVFTIVTAGAIFAQERLTIPTRPADHNAYLSELVLGDTDTESYKLNTGSQERLIVPGRLIAGGQGGNNTISSDAEYVVIGGGINNRVQQDAENAVIGAGNDNSVSAKNASIGAGITNIIEQNAE